MIERVIESKNGRSLIFVFGLLIFFAFAVRTAVVKSPTADEVIHLLRGQTVWQTGDMELQGQHTPLSHWLIGLLFFSEPTAPEISELPSWPTRNAGGLIQEFLWEEGTNVDRLLFLGRLPIILVGLLLGAVVVGWAGKRGGIGSQLVVLCLFAFSPNIIAYAALATTDLVAAAFITGALFVLWRYWQRPSRTLWFLAGAALGFALAAKLTAIFLLPVTLLLCYVSAERGRWWRPGLLWLSFLPVAAVVLWALYGFEIGRVGEFPFPIPAPTYVSNFVEVQAHIERGHTSFLFGEISNEGWWYYFMAAFLVKMPVAVLLLLAIGVVYIVLRKRWQGGIYFWLPAGSLFMAATLSGLNIGYRHILAVVPLSWLLISEAVPWMQKQPRVRWVLGLGLGWYVLVSVGQQPDYLAFFNSAVGGSSRGYQYLGDSNIDWGQDLERLVKYVEAYQDDDLYIGYFGAADPAYYGLDRPQLFDEGGYGQNFSRANPAPGLYALSVNLVQSGTVTEPDLFDWFRGKAPVDYLGYSILIFEVAEDADGEWVAHCFDPEPLVDEETAEQYIGRPSLRHVYFDCRNSWVWPGEEPGWYILPADFEPAFSEHAFPDKLALVFQSTNHPYDTDFLVYYWPGEGDTAEQLTLASSPIVTPNEARVELPLTAENLVRFLGGYGNGMVWGSAWEVLDSSERFLSVQLHLYGESADPVVADGLGYSIVQWQPGDIFVQFVPEEADGSSASGRFLETSIYDLNSGERLEFENGEMGVRIIPEER